MDNKDKIYFSLLKEDAKLPQKRDEDAGYDIYPCFEEDWIVIKPHETVMIPTGIASAFNKKYVAMLKERGSTGTKGLGQRSGIIDSGYRGEWLVPITNHREIIMAIAKKEFLEEQKEFFDGFEKSSYFIYPYEKAICQALILPVPELEVVQVSKEELDAMESERGAGKLGSSGK